MYMTLMCIYPSSTATSVYLTLQLMLCLQGNRKEQEKLLNQSNTLYVGNLSFYTTEEQV